MAYSHRLPELKLVEQKALDERPGRASNLVLSINGWGLRDVCAIEFRDIKKTAQGVGGFAGVTWPAIRVAAACPRASIAQPDFDCVGTQRPRAR